VVKTLPTVQQHRRDLRFILVADHTADSWQLFTQTGLQRCQAAGQQDLSCAGAVRLAGFLPGIGGSSCRHRAGVDDHQVSPLRAVHDVMTRGAKLTREVLDFCLVQSAPDGVKIHLHNYGCTTLKLSNRTVTPGLL